MAKLSEDGKSCICTGGSKPDDEKVCKCDKYIGLTEDTCVNSCPTDSIAIDGVCVCKEGFGIANNRCVKCSNG